MSDPSLQPQDETAGAPARKEIRVVLWGVLALVVVGALYVLVFGSPTRSRATQDSPNGPAVYVYEKTGPGAHPASSSQSSNVVQPSH